MDSSPAVTRRARALARNRVDVLVGFLAKENSEGRAFAQLAADQEVEGTVDGGLPGPLSAAPQALLDLVHREVLRGGEDDVRDALPLKRHRKALLPEIPAEEAHEG